jgi:hypothetical protein
MTQPPPLRPKRRQRAPDLVLRASTHAAAPGEQQPVAGIQAKSEREHEQDSRRRDGSRARNGQRQHDGADARRCRSSSSPRAGGTAGAARSSIPVLPP